MALSCRPLTGMKYTTARPSAALARCTQRERHTRQDDGRHDQHAEGAFVADQLGVSFAELINGGGRQTNGGVPAGWGYLQRMELAVLQERLLKNHLTRGYQLRHHNCRASASTRARIRTCSSGQREREPRTQPMTVRIGFVPAPLLDIRDDTPTIATPPATINCGARQYPLGGARCIEIGGTAPSRSSGTRRACA